MAVNPPATIPEQPVADVFANIVRDVAKVMTDTTHKEAVDLDLKFTSVTIDSRGIPLFTKHTDQSQLEIRLATRLTPK